MRLLLLSALLISAWAASAQDKTGKRLTGLEKRVTKVEKRVTKLEDKPGRIPPWISAVCALAALGLSVFMALLLIFRH